MNVADCRALIEFQALHNLAVDNHFQVIDRHDGLHETAELQFVLTRRQQQVITRLFAGQFEIEDRAVGGHAVSRFQTRQPAVTPLGRIRRAGLQS